MANIFNEVETCFLTPDDVRDSLGGDFVSKTDEELNKLILKAESTVKAYLDSIGYDSCNIDCTGEIPNQFKLATLYVIENNAKSSGQIGGFGVSELPAGAVVSESTCDTSVTYKSGSSSSTQESCGLPCEAIDILDCFTVSGFNYDLCSPCCVTNNCQEEDCLPCNPYNYA